MSCWRPKKIVEENKNCLFSKKKELLCVHKVLRPLQHTTPRRQGRRSRPSSASRRLTSNDVSSRIAYNALPAKNKGLFFSQEPTLDMPLAVVIFRNCISDFYILCSIIISSSSRTVSFRTAGCQLEIRMTIWRRNFCHSWLRICKTVVAVTCSVFNARSCFCHLGELKCKLFFQSWPK